MAGLARICKLHGSIKVSANGKTVVWLYDYANDKPRLKSEMTKEEIAASEKAKWEQLKKHL
jgi:major membrane immunogen (membrane-anchored lipoprotein)